MAVYFKHWAKKSGVMERSKNHFSAANIDCFLFKFYESFKNFVEEIKLKLVENDCNLHRRKRYIDLLHFEIETFS